MAEADVERLSRVESVDTHYAEEALDRTDGDFDAARAILRNAPGAVKLRFASQNSEIYGLATVLLAVSPPELLELDAIIANDQSLGTVGLGDTYSELRQTIAARSNDRSAMAALTERFREGLNEAHSPPSGDMISMLKRRDVEELQENLEETVRNILNQDDIVVTAELETGLLSGVTKTRDSEETSESTTHRSRRADRVLLICQVKVDPVTGQSVQELEPGDMLYVDVDLLQNKHKHLVSVLDNFRDETVGLIPVPIDALKPTDTGKVEIIVQFGENVFGRTVAGEDMNLLTPQSISEDDTTLGGLLSILPWLLAGMLLLTAGLILLYLWVFQV